MNTFAQQKAGDVQHVEKTGTESCGQKWGWEEEIGVGIYTEQDSPDTVLCPVQLGRSHDLFTPTGARCPRLALW